MKMDADLISRTLEWRQERDGLGDIMRKEVGNALWNYLHTLAEWTSPDKEQNVFEVVRKNIEVFPCHKCSEHCVKYIDEHPFNGDLKQYLWEFHNFVNQGIGKTVYPKDILKQYSVVSHDCKGNELINGCLEEVIGEENV